jgi:hypothetical protein
VRKLTLAALLLLAACSSAPSALGPPAAPGGGRLAGRLVAQKSDGSNPVAVAGQTVGVFRQPVIPGKVVQHPPQPVATAVTSRAGTFIFSGLRPGRYFVTVANAHVAVTGRWVTLSAEHGTAVLLVQCTDCPMPL